MGARGQAQISLLPAVCGLVFLVFGRISYRFWGLLLLAASVTLIFIYSNQITPSLKSNFARLDSFGLPILVQTARSPAIEQLKKEESQEAKSSVALPKNPVQLTQEDLNYSRKLTVFATSYDKNCSGCSGTTATGLRTGYGVVAVDPKVIPLGTKLYIPGYGTAVAGDTGGSIKGSKIDLGFDDVKNGWWSSRFVEVYILR